MTVERPALATRREKEVRWCRYGVNPSGTSGNGSPPSGARRKGSATERYGPLTRFSGSTRKSSTTFASSGLDGPKPVVRKSRRAPVTSDATTEGIMRVGACESGSGVQSVCTFPHPSRNVSFRVQHPPDIKVIIAFDGTLANIGKASRNRASQHGSPAADFPASPSLTSSARKSVNGPMSWRTLASSRAAM